MWLPVLGPFHVVSCIACKRNSFMGVLALTGTAQSPRQHHWKDAEWMCPLPVCLHPLQPAAPLGTLILSRLAGSKSQDNGNYSSLLLPPMLLEGNGREVEAAASGITGVGGTQCRAGRGGQWGRVAGKGWQQQEKSPQAFLPNRPGFS